MTLSVGNRLVKRAVTWNQDGSATHGEPIVGDDAEMNVEYEIVDLHTAETDADSGEEQVTARLRKLR